MRKETIEKAVKVLPCSRDELPARLGSSTGWAERVAAYLLKHGYATAWGSALTPKGTLSPILNPTGKQP